MKWCLQGLSVGGVEWAEVCGVSLEDGGFDIGGRVLHLAAWGAVAV